MDPSYLEGISSGRLIAEDIFGTPDGKGGWSIPPRVRYYDEVLGQVFFDSMSAMLRRLPDKRLVDGDWFYVWSNTKAHQKMLSGKYSKTLFSKTNEFWIEAPDGGLQSLIFVDSWPGMLADDEDEASNAMAVEARMFSKQVKRVKSKLRKKAVALIGVNQLRLKPAQMYGSPEYEPGGEALKFWSDFRLRQKPRAIPHGKGQIEVEDSVLEDGAEDQYKYIHVQSIKNKYGTPYLDGWHRIWFEDHKGRGRGFCPVWDTFQYLKMTGQVQGNMKKMRITMEGFPYDGTLSWYDFKSLVLLKGQRGKKFCHDIGITRPPKLRERCFQQLQYGKAQALRVAEKKRSKKK